MTSKAQAMKIKIAEWDYIKVYLSKSKYSKEGKAIQQNERNYLQTTYLVKGEFPKIFKEFLQLKSRNQIKLFRNGQKI